MVVHARLSHAPTISPRDSLALHWGRQETLLDRSQVPNDEPYSDRRGVGHTPPRHSLTVVHTQGSDYASDTPKDVSNLAATLTTHEFLDREDTTITDGVEWLRVLSVWAN
jgi:hypothetical protein